jgi:PAS domain S-box-containing protein
VSGCDLGAGEARSSQLQRLMSEVGIGVWSYDGATRAFVLDEICRGHFGLAPGEPPNPEVMRQRIHPDDIGPYWNAIREVMATDGEFDVQYRIIRPDGSLRFISSRGRVLPHGPGEPLVIDGVCIDISEVRRLEARLHTSEVQLATLAENFPGLFAYVDRDLICRFISDRYLEHNALSREEIVDQHMSVVAGPERFAAREPFYRQALGGKAYSFEEAKTLRGGGERYYAITYYPDRARSGEVRGFMAVGLDITELRSMERDLQEKTADLQRSNHDLEQFAYVASHDLKAPLRAIEVLVEWLREDLAGYRQGEVQENLQLLAQRTGRLHRLLDDLLQFSRAGRTPGDVIEVDTRQMVRDIAVLLAPPAGMKIEADASLPVMITWHAPLEQVLRNLINNAVKHHPTQQGSVRVYAERRDADWVLAVEDDGAGIPAEYSEKVFQMFQTLKPRDEVEGSGMGLAIVKRIVEWQGGRIWFRPGSGGRGTVFKFVWKPASAGASAKSNLHGNDQLRHLAG